MKKLQNHKNQKFVRIFCEIFIFDVKIEYIDSMQLILIKNYFFVFNAFDILTIDFYKQMKIKRITRIDNIF